MGTYDLHAAAANNDEHAIREGIERRVAGVCPIWRAWSIYSIYMVSVGYVQGAGPMRFYIVRCMPLAQLDTYIPESDIQSPYHMAYMSETNPT